MYIILQTILDNILFLILITPILGIILVVFNTTDSMRWQIGLWSSNITLFLSVIIWSIFNSSNAANMYQYIVTFGTDIVSNSIEYSSITLGVDGISIYYIILTTIITPICLLSGRINIKHNISTYINLFLLLEVLLCMVFTVQDIILFYVFFESVLIPLFIIIGIFGTPGNIRIRACFLLFLYTLFGSLAILLCFTLIYYYTGTTSILLLINYKFSFHIQSILFCGIILSIIIKTPLIPFNTWLTFAHTEAPVAGSIILAGIILKLATYGYIRIILTIFPDAVYYYSPIIIIFGTISVIYGSLSTIRQTDFKRIIAYSSVAHIGIVVIGLFSNNIEGIIGGIILSISHGVVSPALFYLVGGVLYDRYHTRIIKYYRGITIYIPIFSIIFFIFTISNSGVPLTGNWIGEFITIVGVYMTNPLLALLSSTSIVFSAIYTLWLYTRISFGSWSTYLSYNIIDINRREYCIILPLLFFTIIIGIIPQFIINDIYTSVLNII